MYVLVHDEAEGGSGGVAHAAEILRQMKAAFPTAPSKYVVGEWDWDLLMAALV